MIYELEDTTKVLKLFEGWQETLIYSCLQKVMGKIFVTDTSDPVSAYAYVGCFAFYAGKPDKELLMNKPEGFVIMTPQNKEWEAMIEECYPEAKKVTRYAIKKDTRFDVDYLRRLSNKLPEGYSLREIDSETYDQCLEAPFSEDFVSSFESKESYLKSGRGMVILKNGRKFYPDFVLLNVKTRKTIYWEHFGLASDVEYSNKNLEKLYFYEKEGMRVGENFVYTIETAANPIDVAVVEEKIQKYLLQ